MDFSSFTEISYCPSRSVIVPLLVPFSTTFTPGIADPSSALVAVPLIVSSLTSANLLAESKMTDKIISSPLIAKEDFHANGVNMSSTEFVGKLNFRCNPDNTTILNKVKDITERIRR